MKDMMKMLSTNLHILFVSLAIVAVGLGFVGVDHQAPDKKQSQSVVITSTPSTSNISPTSDSGNSALPFGGSGSSAGSSSGSSDDGATSGSNSPVPSSPASPPVTICTPCTSTGNCVTTCIPAPAPPVHGCGVCGSSISRPDSKSTQVMCPMYCMQLDQ